MSLVYGVHELGVKSITYINLVFGVHKFGVWLYGVHELRVWSMEYMNLESGHEVHELTGWYTECMS